MMDIVTYINMNEIEHLEFAKNIMTNLPDEFKLKMSKGIPVYTHVKTGLDFVYVPPGKYIRGFSKKEECEAERIEEIVQADYDEMRPTSEVTVKSFLITQTPVCNHFVMKYIDIDYYREDKYYPAYISKKNVDFICNELHLRIPNESEWEYFVRAGGDSLFSFGSTVPNDNVLEQWLSNDLSELEKLQCNRLGIYALYAGEWCGNNYTYGYDNKESEDIFAIRGGGAMFWPWQDSEWVWCMSAMRMPSTDLIDGECGFRLVYDFEE